jgi:hypothetical protein
MQELIKASPKLMKKIGENITKYWKIYITSLLTFAFVFYYILPIFTKVRLNILPIAYAECDKTLTMSINLHRSFVIISGSGFHNNYIWQVKINNKKYNFYYIQQGRLADYLSFGYIKKLEAENFYQISSKDWASINFTNLETQEIGGKLLKAPIPKIVDPITNTNFDTKMFDGEKKNYSTYLSFPKKEIAKEDFLSLADCLRKNPEFQKQLTEKLITDYPSKNLYYGKIDYLIFFY